MSTTTDDPDLARAIAYLSAVKVSPNKYWYEEPNGRFYVTTGTLRVLGVYLRAYTSESEAFDYWCWDTPAEEMTE